MWRRRHTYWGERSWSSNTSFTRPIMSPKLISPYLLQWGGISIIINCSQSLGRHHHLRWDLRPTSSKLATHPGNIDHTDTKEQGQINKEVNTVVTDSAAIMMSHSMSLIFVVALSIWTACKRLSNKKFLTILFTDRMLLMSCLIIFSFFVWIVCMFLPFFAMLFVYIFYPENHLFLEMV